MSDEKSSGAKTAGFVIAGVLILIALLIYFLSNINIKKKDNNVSAVNTEVTTQVVTSVSTTETPSTTSTTEAQQTSDTNVSDSSSVNMLLVDSDKLDLNNEVITSNGIITDKTYFLEGTQLINRLTISVGKDGTTEDMNYYCSYSVLSSVEVNDVVCVDYTMVSENCYTIVSVYK